MADKQHWRRWAASQGSVPDSEPIVRGIEFFLAELSSQTLLTYCAMAGEPDLNLVRFNGTLLVTRTPHTGPLTVHPADAPREVHRWGFSQPVASAPHIDPLVIDVVLVPGVLFDRHGVRLGHGKGYYDQLLAQCRPDVVRIGVTTVGRIVERLPADDHDVAMTHLAAEWGVRRVLA